MKAVFHISLVLLVLIAQAAPLMAWEPPAKEKCTMACCAWLMEAGLGDCSCEAAPTEESQPLPGQLPSSSSARDLASKLLWVELQQLFQHRALSPTDTGHHRGPGYAEETTMSMPHVRLSVLFCSFLT